MDDRAAPARPPAVERVAVDTPGGRYDIWIGDGLWQQPAAWQGLPAAAHAVIVSNPTVHALHGAALRQALAGAGYAQVSELLLPDGEIHKDVSSLQAAWDHLATHGGDRRTVLFALGGGVVGDLTGLAAATWMRGVPYVQVPTTLLAQVDSSVGGKTAINHARGKNLIGAFHQPARVLADLSTLRTLPARELGAGLAEVIKYGPIADAAFLDWLEAEMPALRAGQPAALARAVRRSCEIKAAVVGADEREGGVRAILNFGHTFGHAIEAGQGYGRWLHGEAVGCGMVLAAALSAELGQAAPAFVDRLAALVAAAGLPVAPPPMPAAQWLELMRMDKKAEAGAIRYVLLDGAPGRAALRAVDDATVVRVLGRRGALAG